MASTGMYQSSPKVIPPLKGAFPLDHEKKCNMQMSEYMSCLRKSDNNNEKCREFAKDYFQCRMDQGLMDRDELSRLGYK